VGGLCCKVVVIALFILIVILWLVVCHHRRNGPGMVIIDQILARRVSKLIHAGGTRAAS